MRPWPTFQGCLQCAFLLLHLLVSPLREQEMGGEGARVFLSPSAGGTGYPTHRCQRSLSSGGCWCWDSLADSPWAWLCLR